MIEKIRDKKNELLLEYDRWLEQYENDGLKYQEEKLIILRYQIKLLNELLEGYENK